MNTTDLLFVPGASLGKKIKLLRISRDLNQGDLAFLCTQELHRRGFTHLRITVADISCLENNVSINRRKQKVILSVLGLDDAS